LFASLLFFGTPPAVRVPPSGASMREAVNAWGGRIAPHIKGRKIRVFCLSNLWLSNLLCIPLHSPA